MTLERFRYGAMMAAAGDTLANVRTAECDALAYSEPMAHMGAWIRYDFRPAEERTRGDAGWKVHVSVEMSEIEQAWDAVLPVVGGARLLCKVAGPALLDRLGDPEHRQAGKAIVIYDHGHPLAADPAFWSGLLGDVERALRGAGVRPGWTVGGDRPVAGSGYSHVRNDAAATGAYSRAEGHFNPGGSDCPFDGVTVKSRLPLLPKADPATDAARQLGFVGGDWTAEGNAAVSAGDPFVRGAVLRSLSAQAIPFEWSADAIRVPASSFAALDAGWFRAAQAARTASLGLSLAARWREATDASANVSVRLPSKGADAPVAVLSFAAPGDADAFAAALATCRGVPAAAVDGNAVLVRAPPSIFAGTHVDPRHGAELGAEAPSTAPAMRRSR
jgi:hypothetical protein